MISCWVKSTDNKMLSFDDKCWTELKGGYGVPFDPRAALQKLESGVDVQSAWDELWQGLHHQGSVGEASYAAVPHLVRIHHQRAIVDWNTYAIVATIELARTQGKNPQLMDWLKQEYEKAIHELAQIGLTELSQAKGRETVQSILSVLAIWKGARTCGRVLVECSEDEIHELMNKSG